MQLSGKNWDGEWEPAAATWFKTERGWRLAYGTPVEDRPIGMFDPVWAKLILNIGDATNGEICEKHVRCKYDSQVDAHGCHATYQLYGSGMIKVGEWYHHMGRHQVPTSAEMAIDSSSFPNGFRMEDAPVLMLASGSDGYKPSLWTWESQNAEGYWIQRGTVRDAPCYSTQALMMTEVNPALTGGLKRVEYIEYDWGCPMTKTNKDYPYEE